MTVRRTDLEAPTIRDGVVRAEPHGLPRGAELAGRYRILEQLGEGGMGIVYRARDLSLDLDIAIKVLHPRIAHDPGKVAFFRNEVRVARMVTHPNVCRLHDLEDGPDGCFITMEYIAGESLAARLARGRLARDEVMRVLADVAAGLAAAHAAGVIHRDLKPSNVLLGAGRAVVVDFGIAGEDRELGAGPQDVAGTRGYMAPEQVIGARLDARVDVYALGVLAFVLATARRPPPAAAQTVPAGSSASAFPVAELDAHADDLPPALAALIGDCLAIDPADRPRDAGEVMRRLTAPPPAPAGRRRRAVPVALVALAIALAGAGVAIRAGGDAAVATAPRIALPAIDATALPAGERWLAAAMQRMVADELVEVWGLDVELGAPLPGAVALAGTLSRAPSGQLRLALDGKAFEAGANREIAIAAAARVVADRVPAAARHPTADELAAVGAHDPEAWRLWRRAQHETLLLRWERAIALCRDARARDPAFPLPAVELALSHDDRDVAARADIATAQALLARVPVRPLWSIAVTTGAQLTDGDPAAAMRSAEAARRLDLTPRERLWLELRWAMAVYFNDAPQAAAPALALLAETHPAHPSAFKLLAGLHLASDQPTAAALALRYASRAIELAPDDGGVRADFALALLLAGRTEEARARAAELAQLDPEDKRLARGRLFTLHMALGDLPEAELDARRQLSGTPIQRAEGAGSIAMIDVHWGRFAIGLNALAASAAAYEAIGLTVSAARQRFLAGRLHAQLGDRATAIAMFERVADGPTHYAKVARVLAQVAAGAPGGALDDARRGAAALPEGSLDRATAELAIADAARDDAAVLAAFAQIEKLSTTVEHLFAAADALERTGRLDDAAALFARLAGHIRAWTEPIASTRAHYRLGRLRERAGDRLGARAAYAAVIARWGSATTQIPELDDARRRMRALEH